jgi:hypothetical protein
MPFAANMVCSNASSSTAQSGYGAWCTWPTNVAPRRAENST